MSAAVRLLRLSAKCPECGAPPKLRTVPATIPIFEGQDPDHVVMTVECHVRPCSTRYELKVRHFTEAA